MVCSWYHISVWYASLVDKCKVKQLHISKIIYFLLYIMCLAIQHDIFLNLYTVCNHFLSSLKFTFLFILFQWNLIILCLLRFVCECLVAILSAQSVAQLNLSAILKITRLLTIKSNLYNNRRKFSFTNIRVLFTKKKLFTLNMKCLKSK